MEKIRNVEDKELKIYPKKSYVAVLRVKNNIKLLKDAAPGYFVNIIDTNETDIPENAISLSNKTKEEPKISKKMKGNIDAISDIMGSGEIKEVEDAPF